MNNQQLDAVIREHADTIHRGQPGLWQFDYFGRTLIVLTDETHNRMRIISPVADREQVDSEIALACLSANFDRALDARYAISGDFLWSAFIHPLAPLDIPQVVDAMTQVANLAVTFGTSFSSSGLMFGTEPEEDPESGDDPHPESNGH